MTILSGENGEGPNVYNDRENLIARSGAEPSLHTVKWVVCVGVSVRGTSTVLFRLLVARVREGNTNFEYPRAVVNFTRHFKSPTINYSVVKSQSSFR